MDYHALGQRMKKHRQRLKLTQEQVASIAKLSASFYGRLERGAEIPSIDTLLTLAWILETTPNDLLSAGSECDDPMPYPVKECIHLIRSLLERVEEYYGIK